LAHAMTRSARGRVIGGTPLTGSPADFGRHIAAETEKWGKVIPVTGGDASACLQRAEERMMSQVTAVTALGTTMRRRSLFGR
jgi:hypothetical protein